MLICNHRLPVLNAPRRTFALKWIIRFPSVACGSCIAFIIQSANPQVSRVGQRRDAGRFDATLRENDAKTVSPYRSRLTERGTI
jgi:hypothetical protein